MKIKRINNRGMVDQFEKYLTDNDITLVITEDWVLDGVLTWQASLEYNDEPLEIVHRDSLNKYVLKVSSPSEAEAICRLAYKVLGAKLVNDNVTFRVE